MSAAWSVHDDAEGDETLWYGDTAVLRRFELPSVRISTGQSYDLLWQVLTRVLAPDEATIERLARALHRQFMPNCPCEHTEPVPTGGDVKAVEVVLAALADTSAHGGHMTEVPATCVHNDGTEHPAPSGIYWSPESQRWVRMYGTCDWAGDAHDPRRLGSSRKRVVLADLTDTAAQDAEGAS